MKEFLHELFAPYPSGCLEIRTVDAAWFNRWQAERHYLRRKVIRSKLLAHGVFVGGELVGGLLWGTPHFTKKRGLFGMGGLPDKWEVLMLSRFWLADDSGVVASQAMALSVGKGKPSGSHRTGWRLQEDWVRAHPPPFPENPFVPRLLISYSDTAYGHAGTIYKAAGWEKWDTTDVNYGRWERRGEDAHAGNKTCWILRLAPNPRAERMGKSK